MKMASMKMAPGESEYGMMAEPMKPQEYPYGLKLCLKEGSIAKLGLKELPAVGEEIMITAMVKVVEVCEEESEDRGIERELELQITELGFGEQMDSKKAAEKLYSKG